MNLNLRNKVFLILILLTSIPLIILGTTANYIATDSLEEKLTFLANKTLENLTSYISKDIQNYTSLVFYCSRNSEIIDSLSHENNDKTDNFYRIKSAITKTDVIRQVNYPFQYIVVSADQTIYTNFSHSIFSDHKSWTPAFMEDDWFSELKKSPLSMFRIITGRNELFLKGDDQIYFVSNIIHEFNNIGIVIIGIDEYVIGRLLKNSKTTPGSSVFIFDNNGRLIVEGENNPLSFRKSPKRIEQLISNGHNLSNAFPTHVNIQDNWHMITAKKIEFRESDVSWQVLMLTPEYEISRDLRKISYVNYSLLALCLVAIVILNIIVNRVIVNPVLVLNNLTSQVAEGNLNVRAQELRNDEIGRLGHGFNQMIDSLKSYIESVERQEREKRKLEIRILQNQINPHFLHNVLNTIKWMAELKRAHGISRAVVSMSRLLDYNFSSSDNIVTVKEELSYTDEYVHLQKLRYQNKFSFENYCDEEIFKYPIPKCTFQPIIENSITHGFKGKRGKCIIELKGRIIEDNVVISIIDNGIGINRELLEHLFDRDPVIEDDPIDGIALINIQQRIKLYFGELYGLKVESKRGEGTKVTIILPGPIYSEKRGNSEQ